MEAEFGESVHKKTRQCRLKLQLPTLAAVIPLLVLIVLALLSKEANSSWRLTAITFTNVVFPEYWRPTSVSSISSFQNRDLNQSKSRFMSASISKSAVTQPCGCTCVSLPGQMWRLPADMGSGTQTAVIWSQASETCPTAPPLPPRGTTPSSINHSWQYSESSTHLCSDHSDCLYACFQFYLQNKYTAIKTYFQLLYISRVTFIVRCKSCWCSGWWDAHSSVASQKNEKNKAT